MPEIQSGISDVPLDENKEGDAQSAKTGVILKKMSLADTELYFASNVGYPGEVFDAPPFLIFPSL